METSSTLATARPPAPSAFARIAAALASAGWQAARAWAAARTEQARQERARRELRGLNDHFLKDIGLARSDIDGLFR